MKIPHVYYRLKPFIPRRLSISIRRLLHSTLRYSHRQTWPINYNSSSTPSGWPGWPEHKRFALILTHDVETRIGFQKCPSLVNLEQKYGFRSSLNFVPLTDYMVSREYAARLRKAGFEVGVHDLTHDGKLYSTHSTFLTRAKMINHYLRAWNASGFRSGFMHHNLDWIKALDILYDSSTFDTDPFEPQPDGVHTIFPFCIRRDDGSCYVELPYTLQQDFSLFIVLQEKTIDIWKAKLDWIAAHGGMALINTHPDYMCFNHQPHSLTEYPAHYYSDFLDYVRGKYSQSYWHALPHEVASYYLHKSTTAAADPPARPSTPMLQPPRKRKIWVDLDNTPHVPFFRPIIRELEKRGYDVFVTARDAFQVCELADKLRVSYFRVGRHYGKHYAAKVFGLLRRSTQLAPHALAERPLLAVSHGARSQILLCNVLRIPSVLLFDYEYAAIIPTLRPSWVIVPEAISDHFLPCAPTRALRYSGLKENVYASEFQPDLTLLSNLGIDRSSLIVTVRPPATEAHYHNPWSDVLLEELMAMLVSRQDVQVILLPRNRSQQDLLETAHPNWFHKQKTIIPRTAVDGLSLIWHSDFVVSGGGTMNREAAALDVPVYSIFRGTIGAIDHHLSETGKLTLIETVDDIHSKIVVKRRDRSKSIPNTSSDTLMRIVDHIEDIYTFYADRQIYKRLK